jgi:hypothetical protein
MLHELASSRLLSRQPDTDTDKECAFSVANRLTLKLLRPWHGLTITHYQRRSGMRQRRLVHAMLGGTESGP